MAVKNLAFEADARGSLLAGVEKLAAAVYTVAKGALEETKEGSVSLYSPLISKRRARVEALKSVAANAFDGALGVMMHFLLKERDISPETREELRQLLDDDSEGDRDD